MEEAIYKEQNKIPDKYSPANDSTEDMLKKDEWRRNT